MHVPPPKINRRDLIKNTLGLTCGSTMLMLPAFYAHAETGETINIGNRRELFIDHYLIDQLNDARLKLHHPQTREVVLRFEKPWEGLYSGYITVLKDGKKFRAYYRGMPAAKHDFDTETTCVAFSDDGIQWEKPELGIYKVKGTMKNNVVLARSRGCHNLAPFVDLNPNAKPSERYKAMGGTGKPGLLGFVSPDGLRWKQVSPKPVITQGAFDSQNNAFWSTHESQYVCYFRVFRQGKRWIARSTSKDFINWTRPIDLELDNKPREHLYTNQLTPYSRAPHLYLGLPTRFFPGRTVITKAEAEKIGTPKEWNFIRDCTDIQFVSARGGSQFSRAFMEAYVRPGTDLKNWTSRANYAARGILETGDGELSVYVNHHVGYATSHLRRYTLRPDGFGSIHAGYQSGEFITKPFIFSGAHLYLNYSTSAAGGMLVEIQTAEGQPIKDYMLGDSVEIIGDRSNGLVRWKTKTDVKSLEGQPIRLRFKMKDADLYAIQFDK